MDLLDVREYIKKDSENKFDELITEFKSGMYDSLSACPSYDVCKKICNSMNELCDYKDKVSPESCVYDKLCMPCLDFEVKLKNKKFDVVRHLYYEIELYATYVNGNDKSERQLFFKAYWGASEILRCKDAEECLWEILEDDLYICCEHLKYTFIRKKRKYRTIRKMYLWQEIHNNIVCDIYNGKIKPDDKLPSMREAAINNNVSLIVIKRVYGELNKRGFIYTIPGKGTYVSDTKNMLTVLSNSEFVKVLNMRTDDLEILGKGTINNAKKATLHGVVYTLKNLYTEMLRYVDVEPYFDLLRLLAVKYSRQIFVWLEKHIPDDMTVEEYLKSLENNKK